MVGPGIWESAVVSALLLAAGASATPSATPPRTMSEILAASTAADWRTLDPQQTLYVELSTGRVIIELAPSFAPNHAANVKALVREKYFDGIPIVRSQDNYVVQWGDPDGKREVKAAKKTLPPEFERAAKGLAFNKLVDGDVYAPEVGHAEGFPAAGDPKTGRAWLAHCYGMVGAGRDEAIDSGGGIELYVVTGHAPRHLDRNITLLGRVVRGMELLSALPRGTGALGFYEKPEQHVPIRAIRLAADVPEAERTRIELLRTDTPTFAALVESRRNRPDSWFAFKAGRVELCNVPIPTRP